MVNKWIHKESIIVVTVDTALIAIICLMIGGGISSASLKTFLLFIWLYLLPGISLLRAEITLIEKTTLVPFYGLIATSSVISLLSFLMIDITMPKTLLVSPVLFCTQEIILLIYRHVNTSTKTL